MGLIRLLKLRKRGNALIDTLEEAAEHPELYAEGIWRDRAVHETADLLAEVPMPPVARRYAMNVLGLIQNVYKAPVTTLAGLGAAFLTYLAAGQTPKAAGLAVLTGLLGATHSGQSK